MPSTHVFSFQEALELLKNQMEAMPTHLYKMAVMYKALESGVWSMQCVACKVQCAVGCSLVDPWVKSWQDQYTLG